MSRDIKDMIYQISKAYKNPAILIFEELPEKYKIKLMEFIDEMEKENEGEGEKFLYFILKAKGTHMNFMILTINNLVEKILKFVLDDNQDAFLSCMTQINILLDSYEEKGDHNVH